MAYGDLRTIMPIAGWPEERAREVQINVSGTLGPRFARDSPLEGVEFEPSVPHFVSHRRIVLPPLRDHDEMGRTAATLAASRYPPPATGPARHARGDRAPGAPAATAQPRHRAPAVAMTVAAKSVQPIGER
jgi:hypothetical protein